MMTNRLKRISDDKLKQVVGNMKPFAPYVAYARRGAYIQKESDEKQVDALLAEERKRIGEWLEKKRAQDVTEYIDEVGHRERQLKPLNYAVVYDSDIEALKERKGLIDLHPKEGEE